MVSSRGSLWRHYRFTYFAPGSVTKIEDELIKRSIFSTAAIEGNPLREEEVNKIISNPEIDKDKIENAEKEIINLKAVYEFVKNVEPSNSSFKLTEDLIRQIHKIVTVNIKCENNIAGTYRGHIVKVGDTEHGGIYTPPKILDDIKTLMSEFVDWINSEELLVLDPILQAGLAHFYLGLIHPFGDGNGRTARVVEALLLKMAGIKHVPIMLSNFYYRHLDEYFLVFSSSINNKEHDITAFLDFILRGVIDSLEEIKGKINFFIRKLTLKEYYNGLEKKRKINRRQHNLLLILLDHFEPIKLKDLFDSSYFNILYNKITERTARRDLEKLYNMKLLLLKDGKYDLNVYALE